MTICSLFKLLWSGKVGRANEAELGHVCIVWYIRYIYALSYIVYIISTFGNKPLATQNATRKANILAAPYIYASLMVLLYN